ncbi:CpXC domain-containing protein [Variovorax sp. J22R24]|uniref:CpXC domain-containing protein n=1 Tax=Variovorax gracilis TaxID=3053502 RepID=UPI0025787C18|nr:CpXC domain-containing protein [Variovorax sp. J22R24]MDM0109287.1 CpXC domain-containing protein [Variovorax sp. J22R24]
MSRCIVQAVTCPACGASQQEKLFVSVNGARITEAADRIIDGAWGQWSCLNCGASEVLDTPLLFSDLPGGLWIVQRDRSERDRFAALEKEADAIFQREFIERPPPAIRDQALRVKRRLCFGRAQLADKLLAHREGIDDCGLECLKLVLTRDYLQELYPFGPVEFHLKQADAKALRLHAMTLAGAGPVLEVCVSREKFDAIAEDRQSFQEPFADLFSGLYVNASRYLGDGVT